MSNNLERNCGGFVHQASVPPLHEEPDIWFRLTSELRACKSSQLETWGDLDDLTLGRFLAGEVSPDEQASVEQALQTHPDLRKLTDLVRDILGDVAPVLEPVPETPRILRLAKKTTKRRKLGWLGKHGPLVAAACLLVVLSVAMPRPGFLSAERDDQMQPPMLEAGFASRGVPADLPGGLVLPDAPGAPPEAGSRVVTLTHQQAATFERQGAGSRSRGELGKAMTQLSTAHAYYMHNYGPDHARTQRSACELAQVYGQALNCPGHPEGQDRSFSRAGGRSNSRASSLHLTALALRDRIASQPASKVREVIVPVLVEGLRGNLDSSERLNLVRALGELGPAAQTALPALTERLTTSRDPVEVQAILHTLDQIGLPARSAAQVVAEATRSLHGTTLAKVPDLTSGSFEILGRLTGIESRAGVSDHAGCFTVKVLRETTDQLRQIARRDHLAVAFVTIKGQTAHRDAAALGARMVRVFIDPEAPTVEVLVGSELERDAFPDEVLRSRVLASCRKRDYDRALREGVRVVAGFVAARNHKDPTRRPEK